MQALAEALNEEIQAISTTTSTSSSLPLVSSAPGPLNASENNRNSEASPLQPVAVSAPAPPAVVVPAIAEGAYFVVPTSGDQALSTFLISRACDNSTLTNYFYWYLLIECEDQEATAKQDRKVILM